MFMKNYLVAPFAGLKLLLDDHSLSLQSQFWHLSNYRGTPQIVNVATSQPNTWHKLSEKNSRTSVEVTYLLENAINKFCAPNWTTYFIVGSISRKTWFQKSRSISLAPKIYQCIHFLLHTRSDSIIHSYDSHYYLLQKTKVITKIELLKWIQIKVCGCLTQFPLWRILNAKRYFYSSKFYAEQHFY